jgi:diguanylate cyclase (GGDEF)-like protein
MESKINILLVDDRPENLMAMEAVLERPELNIVKAQSGNDALAATLERDFALVLLDVQMPDMDGFEVAHLMKKNEKTRYIPIIFLTAISKEKKYIFKGYQTGAVDYLLKPLETEILKSKVDVFLQLHRQKQQLHLQTRILDEKITQLLELQKELEDANRQLENLSITDGLTGIANRRRLDNFLETEWRRSVRKATPLSLIMIDIDFFKNYNDHYGHVAGDKCLRKVARALEAGIKRPSDLVARYGGEEFVAVLAETDASGAQLVVEILMDHINALKIPHEASNVSPYITVSQGLGTTIPNRESSPEQLLKAADKALYKAKNSGRNQVKSIVL